MAVHRDTPLVLDAQQDALRRLLLEAAVSDSPEARALADRIAAACMRDGHLWRSMGMPDRDGLNRLMEQNFPALAHANDRGMRWKRFLYRRLCGWSGFDG